MKKILTLLIILSLALTVLVGCDQVQGFIDGILGNKVECTEHVDADNNGKCDNCDADVEPAANNESLEAALAFAHELHKDVPVQTGASYTLGTKIDINGEVFTATWTINTAALTVTPVEGKDEVTVNVPELQEDVEYTLTVTVTNANGESLSRSYNHTAPKFAYATFAEYVAAEDDAPIAIKGIVSALQTTENGNSTPGFYVQDLNNEGGYYVYGCEPTGLAVGMTVDVRGTKDTYSGTYEIVDAAFKILDSTIKTVAPVDFTELVTNAADLKAETIVKQGLLVTLKGVKILEVGGSKNDYYYFQIGEHKAYLRISSSNNPCAKADLENIKTVHGENYGNTADVTGVIAQYSGAFYIIPTGADAFSNIKVVEKSDAEKVQAEINSLNGIPSLILNNGDFTLPVVGSTFDTVTLTWTADNSAIVINGATATVTLPAETTEVTLKVVASLGDATAEKTFTVSLQQPVTLNAVDPVVGTAYNLAFVQGNKNVAYYFAGVMDGYYLGTKDAQASAVKVYIEATDGGYHLYFMVGETKTYINFVVSGTHINGALEAAASTVYVYDETLKTLKATVDGNDYILGTRNDKTYTTIGPVKVSNNPFYAQFVADGSVEGGDQGGNGDGGNTDPVLPGITDIQVNTPYYMSGVMASGNIYFDGTIGTDKSAGRINGTADATKAVAVKLEAGATAGQYYITFVVDGATKYLGVNAEENDSSCFVISDTKDDSCLWTIDASAKTIVSVALPKRGIATQNTSTYYNFSTYSTSNFGDAIYVTTWFVAVDGNGGETGGETGGDQGGDVIPTGNLTLTPDMYSADLTGTSYSTYDGDHTVGSYTVNTSNVMRNTYNTFTALQMKKNGAGVITIKNTEVSSITITLLSTYDYTAHLTVKVGDTELTLPSPESVDAAGVETGVITSNDYAVMRYTITITLDTALTGDVVITNGTGYAVYAESIVIA